MWTFRRPDVKIQDCVIACASKIQDHEFADRIEAAGSRFERYSNEYQEKVLSDSMHQIDPSRFSFPNLSASELQYLYTGRLVGSSGDARRIYDKILANAELGLCSYCIFNSADSLDHFVPKSVVPGLAIEPWNLVPSCTDCNRKLSSTFSVEGNKQPFHPYGQSLNLGRWLYAEVASLKPISIKFFVKPNTDLDLVLQDRIHWQFDQLKLERLYSVVSGSDLVEISHTLTKQFPIARQSTIEEYLFEQSEIQFGINTNRRKGVLYEALAQDPEYCGGSFHIDFFYMP